MWFMRYVAAAAVMGAPLVHAVDIRLYWDMFAAGCDDTSSYSQCSNIAAGVCCSYTSGVFAVKGIGLDTVGVPDQVSAFIGATGQCKSACDSKGGDHTECVDCSFTILGGGAWFHFNSKRAAMETTHTVMADIIGLYDTSLGSHRHFNISSGVPGDIIAEIDSAARNNTRVEDLNPVVLPYEIP
ncbi:uncharacterized protein AKAW2_50011S [Aspergillus luchuensis]|uniref:Uncharacterized protein n=1 Tax=Aspergillus kawachii TaxID=1069201 RepID=A0A146EZI0_ASPKA|nr:uncharacterized protein AKAW2_50011S [Aspergillus luchuensis]BCR99669.1 hypothetical protein AKAW2_50011S [Aspergillus luchuensis]BCS11962.1 hypothetical protein ALUC_50008S [Aspergillus luchuensis]GAA92976.1 hypothetical protein AKAW_11088 [Aspergillus luchuensis IFO 4308]GAT19415.1 hypothetical protein RIB2604_00500190 [Aspergillus luchuensis]